MAVTLYKSTDASAPVLTGAVGSLTALLDAILVNGYGTQAAAGWTIAFTGTNQRDYKQGTGSNGFYLDVNDAGPGSGGAREARMRGYEAMTALATGTNPVPTVAQSSFGVVCRKSNTADATARAWYCVADATCFHLFVDTGDFTGPAYAMCFSFGDFFSYKSGDTYNTAIIGRSGENNSGDNVELMPLLNALSTTSSTLNLGPTSLGQFVFRTWTGAGGSVNTGKISALLAHQMSNGTTIPTTMGSQLYLALPFPNGPDGAAEIAPIYLAHNTAVRGYLKGLWAPCHGQPFGHTDTFSGTGNMAGKSFMALNVRSSASQNNNNPSGGGALGQIIVETSNTWS